MGADTVAEKAVGPPPRAIHILIDEHESAGRQFLTERSAGGDGEHIGAADHLQRREVGAIVQLRRGQPVPPAMAGKKGDGRIPDRSEEHTSELQSTIRPSYAVFCLKNTSYKTKHTNQN